MAEEFSRGHVDKGVHFGEPLRLSDEEVLDTLDLVTPHVVTMAGENLGETPIPGPQAEAEPSPPPES